MATIYIAEVDEHTYDNLVDYFPHICLATSMEEADELIMDKVNELKRDYPDIAENEYGKAYYGDGFYYETHICQETLEEVMTKYEYDQMSLQATILEMYIRRPGPFANVHITYKDDKTGFDTFILLRPLVTPRTRINDDHVFYEVDDVFDLADLARTDNAASEFIVDNFYGFFDEQ